MRIQIINRQFVLSSLKMGIKTFNSKNECSDFIAKNIKILK